MKIILPHNHEHAGVMHFAGEEFDFTEAQYTWFIAATNTIRAGDREADQNTPGTEAWAQAVMAASKAEREAAKAEEEAELVEDYAKHESGEDFGYGSKDAK
jgi:hypothetical protein